MISIHFKALILIVALFVNVATGNDRLCEEIKFECLPESLDALTKMENKKHENKGDKIMLITSLDKDFFKKTEVKQFMDEMEKKLEKDFPGFWKDVPRKVRYRWIRRAMSKAGKFGYQVENNNLMVEICARIGVDFDLNPKWKNITRFIAESRRNLVYARDYIDYTVFDKKYFDENRKQPYTEWHFRRIPDYLPFPEEKLLPKLDEL